MASATGTFDIKFYKMTEQNNVINKTMTEEITKNGTLKDESSIYTPIITVNKDSNLFYRNYCHIAEFGRYYFITDIIVKNNFMEIHCQVDVIETFKGDILESNQCITRQENDFNWYIVDELVQSTNQTDFDYVQIGQTPFSDTDYSSDFYNVVITNLGTFKTLSNTEEQTTTEEE